MTCLFMVFFPLFVFTSAEAKNIDTVIAETDNGSIEDLYNLGKTYLTRIIHESLYCDRHLHAVSVRTRASRLDIPPGMPASLIAVCGPI
jgi:hypothetical protein